MNSKWPSRTITSEKVCIFIIILLTVTDLQIEDIPKHFVNTARQCYYSHVQANSTLSHKNAVMQYIEILEYFFLEIKYLEFFKE